MGASSSARALGPSSAAALSVVVMATLLTAPLAAPTQAQPGDPRIVHPLLLPTQTPPARPSRADILSAMTSVAARVRTCGAGPGSVVRVAVTFAYDGSVSSASI